MGQTPEDKKPNYLAQRIFQLLAAIISMAAILFFAAGGMNWLGAWAFLIGYLAMIAVNAAFILPRGTEIIEERARFRTDVVAWDRWISLLIVIIGQLVSLLVAGLDRRMAWSPPLAVWLVILGGLLMLGGFGLSSWSMITNRFFSTQVRIQLERGHAVVDTGPYNFIRHPGYLGLFLALPGAALLLGSLWALIPAVIGMGLTIARTSLEDRYLHERLDGYREYAGKVHFRLIPGVW